MVFFILANSQPRGVHFTAAPEGSLTLPLSPCVETSPGQELGMATIGGEGGFCFLHPKSEVRVWVAIII